MSELKPCPFCGGKANAHTYNRPDNWVAKCATEECLVSPSTKSGFGVDGYETKAEAIAAWNTRAADTENAALLNRLAEVECKAQKYRAFFDRMMEDCADGGEFISDEVINIAEAFGLTKWLTYDSNNETMLDYCSGFTVDLEDGDRFWFVVGNAPELDALAAAPDAQKEAPDGE